MLRVLLVECYLLDVSSVSATHGTGKAFGRSFTTNHDHSDKYHSLNFVNYCSSINRQTAMWPIVLHTTLHSQFARLWPLSVYWRFLSTLFLIISLCPRAIRRRCQCTSMCQHIDTHTAPCTTAWTTLQSGIDDSAKFAFVFPFCVCSRWASFDRLLVTMSLTARLLHRERHEKEHP